MLSSKDPKQIDTCTMLAPKVNEAEVPDQLIHVPTVLGYMACNSCAVFGESIIITPSSPWTPTSIFHLIFKSVRKVCYQKPFYYHSTSFPHHFCTCFMRGKNDKCTMVLINLPASYSDIINISSTVMRGVMHKSR